MCPRASSSDPEELWKCCRLLSVACKWTRPFWGQIAGGEHAIVEAQMLIFMVVHHWSWTSDAGYRVNSDSVALLLHVLQEPQLMDWSKDNATREARKHLQLFWRGSATVCDPNPPRGADLKWGGGSEEFHKRGENRRK